MNKRLAYLSPAAPFSFLIIFLLLIAPAFPALAQMSIPGSGNCLRLDGMNDYLLAGSDNRGVSDKVTVEAWIKTSSNELSWILGKYSNSKGEDAGYELLLSNGYAVLYGRDGSNTYRSSGLSSTRVSDNRWHHIAGVFDRGRWEIWVDGILENSLNTGYTQGSLATVRPQLSIGIYQEFNNLFFPGEIDEVRIWNTARTREEIRKHMCLKLKGQEANLVAYFTFDAIERNNTFRDYSPSNLGAQLVNTTSNLGMTTSGAPLGDEVIQEYRTAWQGDWTTDGIEMNKPGYDVFQMQAVAAQVKGAHIYRVNGAPNSTTNVDQSAIRNYYYGVFTVGGAQFATYSIHYEVGTASSCRALFTRADNSQMNWMRLPALTVPGAALLTKPGEMGRGEYLLNSGETLKIKMSGVVDNCSSPSAVLTASAGAGAYLWSTGETTAAIKVQQPGKYWVRALLDVCSVSDTLMVQFQQEPPVVFSGDTLLCEGSTLLLSAGNLPGATFLWQDGATAASFLVEREGAYWVTISQGNCTTTSRLRVRYEDCNIFIPNIITPNADARNETFFIRNINPKDWSLDIYNRWGKRIYQARQYGNDWPTSKVPEGVYYYKLTNPAQGRSYKGSVEVVR